MRDGHAFSRTFGVEIAAIASAVPEYRIDQAAVRDMVLAKAPELRSHEGLFLNTGIKTRSSNPRLEDAQCRLPRRGDQPFGTGSARLRETRKYRT
jgi:hypothetical protein